LLDNSRDGLIVENSLRVQQRHNLSVSGSGDATMIFAHGFGCDQDMWRLLAPSFEERFRVLKYDLMGSGASDLSAYDRRKYGSLHGHAADLLEIIETWTEGPVIFVGHSVSAIIGLLATVQAPERFAAQIMIGPSPCYINDGDYVGGFTREDIDELLDTMDANYLGWSSNLAPAIMGAPEQPQLAEELTNSFCRNDPDIARHFAKVTFLSDHRADVPKSSTPALVLQCSDDLIAPRTVGDYLQQHLQRSVLHVIENIGHCPHMSAPGASSRAIDDFLADHLR
jgi:sigma-B regulation protein RsbQ